MIRLTLRDLLKQKRKSVYWLAQETGVRYATLHRMATKEVEKIDLGVLDKICAALRCAPGELLERREEE